MKHQASQNHYIANSQIQAMLSDLYISNSWVKLSALPILPCPLCRDITCMRILPHCLQTIMLEQMNEDGSWPREDIHIQREKIQTIDTQKRKGDIW